MTQYELVFHPEVEADIEDAYNFYEDKADYLGERFLADLEGCYGKIKKSPKLYGMINKYYRKISLKFFPYILVYEVRRMRINILAVFHTSRNPRLIEQRKVE